MSGKIDYVTRQHIQMLIANDEFEKTLHYINQLVQSNQEEYCKWDYFRYVVEADIELGELKHAHSICLVRIKDKSNPLDLVYESLGDVNSAIAAQSNKAKEIWLERALKCYLKSYSYNKNNVIVYKKIATAYEEYGDAENAILWLKKAIEKDSSYILAYYQASTLLENQKKYDEAIRILQDLKKVFPSEDISYTVAGILKTKGDLKGAIKEYRKGTSSDDYGFIYKEIAHCYEELKDYTNVVKTYKKIATDCPKSQIEFVYELIGEFYTRNHKYNKAIEYFNLILHRRNGEYSEYYKRDAYYNLMKIYFEKKQYKKSLRCALNAKKSYVKQAKENSEWASEVIGELTDIYVYIGNCYLELNTHQLASIKAYKKVLYLTQFFTQEHLVNWAKAVCPKIYNTIAILYLALDKHNQVESYLQLEEDKQKELPEYYMIKAELAYRNKNLKEVDKYWKLAQKHAKDDTIQKEAKDRLSFLKYVSSKK